MPLKFVLRLCFVFAMIVGLAPAGLAQTGKGELQKVTAFKVQSAGFGKAAAACGLEKQAAIDAFAAPLREAGAGIVESSSGYWISVRVSTMFLDQELCITYVETAIFQTTRYFNTATLSERVGKIQHWVDGGLFTSGPEGHPRTVLRGFRDLGRRAADTWAQDQNS
jgi:hypothetical protein